MDDCTLFTCSEFWKDVKKLGKQIKPTLLEVDLPPEEFEKLSVSDKLLAIPLLRQTSNAIRNKIAALNELPNNDKNGQQPFLSEDWILWKMRWGVDKHGPSYGLRVMYATNGKHIVLLAIKHKKEVKDSESNFQKDTIDRMKMFLAYDYKNSK